MEVQNDIKLEIATATSRMATRWTNKRVTWSALVNKCSETHRTTETVAQYAAMSRDEQSQRKDIGGFVGGYLKGGKRKNGMTEFKTLATLDIDYGTQDLWDDFTMEFACAAMLYSTHKHTPEKPRYRLVIPFRRKVTPEEYEPLCRKIAATLGINLFDDTTFELPRLFYWPSTSKDGEYVFRFQDGPILDPDEVLAGYTNWRDASEWPMSAREKERIPRDIKKQEDPCAKNGIIGAFCRAYTIEEAIDTFLADKYVRTAQEGRYTYSGGSVAGGLVCYEDKFAYSHHETDPASRQLLNAFDLVRVHLYGDRDEGKRTEDTTRLPSYAAMMEFAAKDGRVKMEALLPGRRATATEDFGEAGEDGGDEWVKQLEIGKDGKPKPTTGNIILIMENHPGLKGKLVKDEFSHYNLVEGELPWKRERGPWSNADDANLRVFLEQDPYGIVSRDKVRDSVSVVYSRHAFNPVRDYLDALQWDGTLRVDTLVSDYLGAPDTPLVRAMTRKQLTAAVARVYEPGCKHDYVLVLTGPEGIGKSTLLNTLGGRWFSDSLNTFEGKDAMELLQPAWLLELSELSALKRSELEGVKQFLSRQVDEYRPAYAERTEKRPRHCVFFGTTNETSFLKGDTGNRRFWVIPTGVTEPHKSVFDGGLEGERDQIWAEAVHYYRKGEKRYLPVALEAEARKVQEDFNTLSEDPLVGVIREYLERRLPADWEGMTIEQRRAWIRNGDDFGDGAVLRRDKVCAAEIIVEVLGKSLNEKSTYDAKTVCAAVRKIEGWEWAGKTMRFGPYGPQKGFVRIVKPTEEEDDL